MGAKTRKFLIKEYDRPVESGGVYVCMCVYVPFDELIFKNREQSFENVKLY